MVERQGMGAGGAVRRIQCPYPRRLKNAPAEEVPDALVAAGLVTFHQARVGVVIFFLMRTAKLSAACWGGGSFELLALGRNSTTATAIRARET